MADIINIIEDGGDIQLKCGWEYERLEMYEGADPGIILGVYKVDGEGGYRLIAHDYKGRVVHADGVKHADLTHNVAEALMLLPVKRTFKVWVQRIVTERAWVEIEAVDDETAEVDAVTYVEDNYRDIDWDEYTDPEYEAMQVKEGR